MKTATATQPILYAAYGANTNREHMKHRCPTAVYLGNVEIFDYRLVFRSVADVIPHKGASVVCALWDIYQRDEEALDVFEGFPNHYTKRFAMMRGRGKPRDVMFYIINGNRADRHEPPESYEMTLRKGYRQCGIAEDQINSAIADARNSYRRELRYRGKWSRAQSDAPRDVYVPRVPFANANRALRDWDRNGTFDWIDASSFKED